MCVSIDQMNYCSIFHWGTIYRECSGILGFPENSRKIPQIHTKTLFSRKAEHLFSEIFWDFARISGTSTNRPFNIAKVKYSFLFVSGSFFTFPWQSKTRSCAPEYPSTFIKGSTLTICKTAWRVQWSNVKGIGWKRMS